MTRLLVYSGAVSRETVTEALRARRTGLSTRPSSWRFFSKRFGPSRRVGLTCAVRNAYVGSRPRKGRRALLTESPRADDREVDRGRFSSKEMAARLSISAKTVEHHRAHVMEKLDVHSVAGVTRYAIRQGWVSTEQ